MQQAMQEQLERFGGGNNLRQNLNDQGVYSAIVVISTIPIIIVYPFRRNTLQSGIMLWFNKGLKQIDLFFIVTITRKVVL